MFYYFTISYSYKIMSIVSVFGNIIQWCDTAHLFQLCIQWCHLGVCVYTTEIVKCYKAGLYLLVIVSRFKKVIVKLLMKIKLKMFHVCGCCIVTRPPNWRNILSIFKIYHDFNKDVAYITEEQVKFWHKSSSFIFVFM